VDQIDDVLYITAICQWLKQLPQIKNDWLRLMAPAIGVLLALGALLFAHRLWWDSGFVAPDPLECFNRVKAGFSYGVASVLGYHLQKKMGLNILPSGPDNYEVPTADNDKGDPQ
jgi:hypothetical protein